jgi:ubiquinone/menaquinone biosynthesis C-methylase UbiE
MATTGETFQLSARIARLYEERFVPRLFAPWARHVVDAAELAAAERVLDVACGTGIVARTAADRLGSGATVTGLDINENMLDVARRIRPDIEWRHGDALELPVPDAAFDVVLCQAALMFLPDVPRALGEMARVVKPGGRVVVQVWGSLQTQPAYSCFVEVAARHAGPDAVSLLGTYWSLGDIQSLERKLEGAGLDVIERRTRLEPARFDSIDELVRIEMDSTPLGERVTTEVYERILDDSRHALRSFVLPTGEAEIPLRGHVLAARRRPLGRG